MSVHIAFRIPVSDTSSHPDDVALSLPRETPLGSAGWLAGGLHCSDSPPVTTTGMDTELYRFVGRVRSKWVPSGGAQ